MKRLILIIALGVAAHAQTPVTVTGTVQAPNGAVATSGYVEFDISPQSLSTAYHIQGTALIAPQKGQCGINGSGQLKNLALSGNCQVWGNDLILPANTLYTIVVAPNGSITSRIQNVLLSGSSADLSNLTLMSPQPVIGTSINFSPMMTGSLIPSAANVYTLGDPQHPYANIYASGLNGLPSGSCAANTQLMFNRSGTCGGSSSLIFDANNIFNVVNTGVFTNTQNNEQAQFKLGGCDPSTEFSAVQSNKTTDALAGCVTGPANSKVGQYQAVAGYANCGSPGFDNGGSNCAAGYFQTRVTANNAEPWGANEICWDGGSYTGVVLKCNEVDLNVGNAGTTAYGYVVYSGWSAVPAASYPFAVFAPGGGSGGQHTASFTSNNGAAALGVNIGALATSGTSDSQGIQFGSLNGGVGVYNKLYNNHFGDLIGTITAGRYFALYNGTRYFNFTYSVTADRTISWGDYSGTPILDSAAQTMTSKTLTSPVINGTPTGTGLPTITLKKGSGSGNYTHSGDTNYAVVDATNLCYTATIPTGWKLVVEAQAALTTGTAPDLVSMALTDNAACSTANAGILNETTMVGEAAGAESAKLVWVIAGDGNSHNVALQFKTAAGNHAATAVNSSATLTPTMVFMLMPSN